MPGVDSMTKTQRQAQFITSHMGASIYAIVQVIQFIGVNAFHMYGLANTGWLETDKSAQDWRERRNKHTGPFRGFLHAKYGLPALFETQSTTPVSPPKCTTPKLARSTVSVPTQRSTQTKHQCMLRNVGQWTRKMGVPFPRVLVSVRAGPSNSTHNHTTYVYGVIKDRHRRTVVPAMVTFAGIRCTRSTSGQKRQARAQTDRKQAGLSRKSPKRHVTSLPHSRWVMWKWGIPASMSITEKQGNSYSRNKLTTTAGTS
jgi:hypothetical protein